MKRMFGKTGRTEIQNCVQRKRISERENSERDHVKNKRLKSTRNCTKESEKQRQRERGKKISKQESI